MRRPTLLLCLLFTLALTHDAAAKPIKDELPPAARTSWDNARALYDAQNWGAALGEYQHAYDVSHNPRVLFNVGVCEKNLGHYLKASVAFRKELADGGTKLPQNEKSAAESALATLEPLITTLVVAASEDGATLTIDGEDQPGTSPFAAPISVDVGVHKLKLSKPGFNDAVMESLTVVSGEVARAKLVLQPIERKGHAHVDVRGPSRAVMYVDGKDVGNAPFDGDLTEGAHVFEARAEDYVTAREPAAVKYKESTALVISMSLKRHEGLLRVVAVPDGATIEIDGKRVGTSHWEGPLTAKNGHSVVVKKDGFYSQTQEVVLDDDQERSLPVTLNPEKNWIWWALGAAVVVGGSIAIGYFVVHQTSPDPVPGTLAAGSGWGVTNHGFHF